MIEIQNFHLVLGHNLNPRTQEARRYRVNLTKDEKRIVTQINNTPLQI